MLRLLNEKPFSGSELMTIIGKRTDGHWKPSPGSIYPLLARLHEKGYTTAVPDPEPGIKRYTLTDQGKVFLEEHVKRRQESRKRIGFFPPPFIGLHWFNHYPEKASELVEAGKRLEQVAPKVDEVAGLPVPAAPTNLKRNPLKAADPDFIARSLRA